MDLRRAAQSQNSLDAVFHEAHADVVDGRMSVARDDHGLIQFDEQLDQGDYGGSLAGSGHSRDQNVVVCADGA